MTPMWVGTEVARIGGDGERRGGGAQQVGIDDRLVLEGDLEPHAYLADVIIKIVNDHPNSRIDELLPWAYLNAPPLRRGA